MSLQGGVGIGFRRTAGALFLVAAALVACGDEGGGSGGGDDKKDQGFFPDGGDGGSGGGGTGGEGGTAGAVVGGEGGGGTGGDQPGGSADMGLPPDMGCVCARNLMCDAAGDCVERSPCAADLDCREGRVCVDGACTDGCGTDADCPDAPANHCVEGRCVQCTDDAECFGRMTCDPATRLCVEAACPPDGPGCEDSRECTTGRVCNVRAGCCEAPFDCRAAEAGCAEGLACDAGTGRCVLKDECESNADCPVGQACLPGRQRLCGPCSEDDHCDGTQICQAGVCVEGPCDSDADCQGNRVCINGECQVPPCQDDAAEDHDTPETAEELLGGGAFGAQSCGGDDDFYRVELPRNNAATITVRADGLGAELDLEVTDAAGAPVASGATSGPVEAVVAGPFQVNRTLIIRVFQRGPQGAVGYTFDLALRDVGEMPGCPDDGLDETTGDDSDETARQLRAADTPPIDQTIDDGRLCPGDEDWMCLTLEDGEDLLVEGAVTNGDLVMKAELINAANDTPLGEVTWQQGMEAMPLSRSQRGTYCVRLSLEAGRGGGYRIRFATTSRAVEEFCRAAEPLMLDPAGTARVSGRLSEEDLIGASCGSANQDGGEAAFDIEVAQPRLLVARAWGEPGGTLGDPLISVRSSCVSANSELGCNDDRPNPAAPYLIEANPAEIRVPVEAAGTVTVIVDGTNQGDRPDFRLEVELLPLSAVPPNDRCAIAAPIALADGLGRIRVNLDRAGDDLGAACLAASGPDAVYSLHVDARSRVSAQVYADFAAGVYLVQNCGGAAAPLACGSGFDLADVAPGDYFLVVEGVGGQARGRVQGDVIVEPWGAPPANDTCAGARALDAGGGELEGDTRGASDDVQLAEGNGCTGDNTVGGDVVYQLPVTGGQGYFVEATPEAGWDLSLMVVSDCASPGASCVAGHDGALTERAEFTAAAGDESVFVIVDGANGERGPFTLRWGALQ